MAEKEETKDAAKVTTMPQETRAALALVPPPGSAGYVMFQAPAMTEDRKAFLKRQFCPITCRDIDFEFFIAYCERTGLDPVLKQAYLIERKTKIFTAHPQGGFTEQEIVKYEPFTAEAGMAAKADAFPDFEGMSDGVVYEGDEFSIDYANGTVKHVANPLSRGKLIGAWAHVQRKGRVVPITWLRVEERMQTTKGRDGKEERATRFWDKMGPTQILKCARAEQWRQGWPNMFGGQYVPEEMSEEIDVTPTPPAAIPTVTANRDTTDKLADKARAAKDASRPGAESVPPGQRTVTVEVTNKSATGGGEVKPVVHKPDPEAADMTKLAADPNSFMNEPTPAEIAALVPKLKAASAIFDEAKLTQRVYFDEQVSKLAQYVKLTTGTVSASDVERAQKAGPPPVDPGPVMVYGPEGVKGKPISSLDGPTLHSMILLGAQKLPGLKDDERSSRATKVQKVETCIKALEAEQRRREEALINEQPPREPGDDVD